MIGDVYKILEHVQNIQDVQIAKSLFLLYFPSIIQFLLWHFLLFSLGRP